MFRITCSSERCDGGFRLLANEHWRINERKPVVLEGPLAALWGQLLPLSALPLKQQRSALHRMDRESRARLIMALSSLRRAGFVDFQAEDDDQPLEIVLKRPRLLKLHLEITHRCNFRCKACYLGSHLHPASAEHSHEGSAEEWIPVIKDSAELGCSYATVTGGEPFLKKDIFPILEALTDRCIISEVNTNGSPITAQMARKLSGLLISNISVSLYGSDRESAEQYSGNGAGHQAAMKALRHLREAQVPLNVKYFATRDNHEGFEAVREELSRIGVDLTITGHSIHGDIFEGKLLGDGLMASDLPRPDKVVQDRQLPCHPTRTEIAIEPNGNIRACPKISVYFGNAFRDGLKNIWDSSTDMVDFRRFWIDYCEAEGYIKGSEQGSLCPASQLLSKPSGLQRFNGQLDTWKNGERLVQISL